MGRKSSKSKGRRKATPKNAKAAREQAIRDKEEQKEMTEQLQKERIEQDRQLYAQYVICRFAKKITMSITLTKMLDTEKENLKQSQVLEKLAPIVVQVEMVNPINGRDTRLQKSNDPTIRINMPRPLNTTDNNRSRWENSSQDRILETSIEMRETSLDKTGTRRANWKGFADYIRRRHRRTQYNNQPDVNFNGEIITLDEATQRMDAEFQQVSRQGKSYIKHSKMIAIYERTLERVNQERARIESIRMQKIWQRKSAISREHDKKVAVIKKHVNSAFEEATDNMARRIFNKEISYWGFFRPFNMPTKHTRRAKKNLDYEWWWFNRDHPNYQGDANKFRETVNLKQWRLEKQSRQEQQYIQDYDDQDIDYDAFD
uniref:Uncharacterized protein n=1 Tax=Megaviridae environmental sample TaxID=1737588 RepID=A0A5J6VI50_9VIRU|nr:MAG: hypothetical protein [Megaviridae environmental sample]